MCESEVTQSCPTLSDPMDCSLPGSSVHGIFQARVLEWDAIAFSGFLCYGVKKKALILSQICRMTIIKQQQHKTSVGKDM